LGSQCDARTLARQHRDLKADLGGTSKVNLNATCRDLDHTQEIDMDNAITGWREVLSAVPDFSFQKYNFFA
jgi:hypothetical protein